MSNHLAKGRSESRVEIMQRVAKKSILSVKTIMAESELTRAEILSVLEVMADSFSKSIKANNDKPTK